MSDGWHINVYENQHAYELWNQPLLPTTFSNCAGEGFLNGRIKTKQQNALDTPCTAITIKHMFVQYLMHNMALNMRCSFIFFTYREEKQKDKKSPWRRGMVE